MESFSFSLPIAALFLNKGEHFYAAVERELNSLNHPSSYLGGMITDDYASLYSFIYSDVFTYKITRSANDLTRVIVDFFIHISWLPREEVESNTVFIAPLYTLETGFLKLLRFSVFSWFLRASFQGPLEADGCVELSMLACQRELEFWEYDLHAYKKDEAAIVSADVQKQFDMVRGGLHRACQNEGGICTQEEFLSWVNAFFSNEHHSLLIVAQNVFFDYHKLLVFLCDIAYEDAAIAPFINRAKIAYDMQFFIREYERIKLSFQLKLLQLNYLSCRVNSLTAEASLEMCNLPMYENLLQRFSGRMQQLSEDATETRDSLRKLSKKKSAMEKASLITTLLVKPRLH